MSDTTWYLRFENNDRMVMITDGIIECRNREGTVFGFERFETFIRENSFLQARDFSKKLIKSIESWSYPSGFFNDDITLLVIDIA